MLLPKYMEQFRKDLTVKNYCQSTIDNYVSQIGSFLQFFSKTHTEPAKINENNIKDYLLSSSCVNSQKHRHSAIKLFYKLTIHQPKKFRYIEYARRERKLPQIIEEDEIQMIINVCNNLKHKTIMCLLYACGLRISEVINLKLENIFTNTIDIISAKGKKDRIVPLPASLRALIEKYIYHYSPDIYLFNGQGSLQYSARSIGEFIKSYAAKAGISRNIHAHLFRHSYSTHSLEQGTDIHTLKEILGHNNIRTTEIYLHTSRKYIAKVSSPIQNITI